MEERGFVLLKVISTSSPSALSFSPPFLDANYLGCQVLHISLLCKFISQETARAVDGTGQNRSLKQKMVTKQEVVRESAECGFIDEESGLQLRR